MEEKICSTVVYAACVTELKNEAIYKKAYKNVSMERQKKADSFRFQKDKILSIGSELLLKQGLSDLGINIKDISYRYGENGKPYLHDMENVHFNISHSEDVVICAISPEKTGCDIEKTGKYSLETAERFFHNSEYELILSQGDDRLKQEMFFRLWTLKESYIKMTGSGLRIPLNSFYVSFKDNKVILEQNLPYGKCYFQEMDLFDGYKSSLCGLSSDIGKNQIFCKIPDITDMLK